MQFTKVEAHGDEVRIEGACLGYVADKVKPGRKVELTLQGPFSGTPEEVIALVI